MATDEPHKPVLLPTSAPLRIACLVILSWSAAPASSVKPLFAMCSARFFSIAVAKPRLATCLPICVPIPAPPIKEAAVGTSSPVLSAKNGKISLGP